MKKQNRFSVISILATLAIVLIFIACDDKIPESGSKTIDSRLVGGKWTLSRTTPNQYFRFTSTTYTVANNGVASEITINAYTKDGKVLSVDGDNEMLRYAFLQPSEFNAELSAAMATGNHQKIFQVDRKIKMAETGYYVRFTVLGSGSVDWFDWDRGILPPGY